jgi:hypothetical protein
MVSVSCRENFAQAVQICFGVSLIIASLVVQTVVAVEMLSPGKQIEINPMMELM